MSIAETIALMTLVIAAIRLGIEVGGKLKR